MPTRPRSGANTPSPCNRRSSAKPGTATGIGAATSTTGRRWDRSRAMSAASTRSRSPGPSYPAARRRARAVRAMSAVNAQLVSRSEGLVQLFTPPFDRTPHDPGYIKAYPPGLRENGGQYTHAAMWSHARVCAARGRRSGGRAVLAAQPDQSCEHARGDSPLQGRALCRLRGCVLGAGAHRPRRLDLVYGLGGLDVPHRGRRHPGNQPARRRASDRSLHSAHLAGIRDHLQARLVALSHRGGEPARREPRNHSRLARRARYPGHALRYRASRTMARITTCASRSGEASAVT